MMICSFCKGGEHETCKAANENKQPSACDCQHRVDKSTIVLPAATKLELEKIFK
jgi:hypothetical protein